MSGKNAKKIFLLWSDMNLNLEEWKDDLLASDPDLNPDDDDNLYRRMLETNESYLDDERANLSSIIFDEPILVIGDLGLWNGRRSGYKEIPSGKVSDCLYSSVGGDTRMQWYVDVYGNLRADEAHHDGMNHYLYRVWKPGTTDTQKDFLKREILNGGARADLIARYTVRVGTTIADIYGWPVRGSKAYIAAHPPVNGKQKQAEPT